MIKAIFFDFDGVLTLLPNGRTPIMQNLAEKTGVSLENVEACYFPFNKDLKLGNIMHEDIWEKFCACIGTSSDISILEYVFRHVPLNQDMISLLRQLKERGFILGIISNNFQERLASILDEFNLHTLFTVTLTSSEIGSMKDEPEIFEQAMALAGVWPEESVYIDNSHENLVVPEEMGMKTFYFDFEKKDIAGLVSQLREWDVNI